MRQIAQLLRAVFKGHRGRISITYALVLVEQTLVLLYPFVTGLAIDDLIRGAFTGLYAFVALYLAHMIISAVRQVYDTRTYARIYATLTSETVLEQQRQGVEMSQVVARAGMLWELTDFLQTDMPYMIESVFAVVGALIMLGFYDPALAGVALLVFIPIILINRAYFRVSTRLNRGYNNQLEREVRALQTFTPQRIRRHYQRLTFWMIRLSDAEARNYFLIHIFMLGLMTLSIYRSATSGALEVGDIFAVISYMWAFIEGLDSVPWLVQKVSRLHDISSRMQSLLPGNAAKV